MPMCGLHLFIAAAWIHASSTPATHDLPSHRTHAWHSVLPREPVPFLLSTCAIYAADAPIECEGRSNLSPRPSFPTSTLQHEPWACRVQHVFRHHAVFGRVPACGRLWFLLPVKGVNQPDGLVSAGMHMYAVRTCASTYTCANSTRLAGTTYLIDSR
ncbi:hypothetical protein P171DRAFT_145307 [Karstenula rhodostoma CBS 690.94]|uniref:Secreted protein n=1 Tax=Karstenula rhodostoma CBS 690.94 TaxID=1392251 RepID=A0A9P4PUX2_9PLEO|nr:hypothetical protein P171DRAFT_145307 [Karstenula rhodostoma CBS 690.94]